MPKFNYLITSKIERSARVMQLEGLFQLAPTQRSESRWIGELPLENRSWSIGMIVGPSGAGKSSLARHLFGENLISGYEWGDDSSIVDSFPPEMGIKQITGLLSQVGFSSPPAWLRPFRNLSNGEQFRVNMARAIAEADGLFVIDEFSSVLDRTVAQIGSAAIARAIRAVPKRQMIAVGVHYDVIDWLQPDWIFEPHINRFQWRELQRRPAIKLTIVMCDPSAWKLFKRHHYLDSTLHKASKCFCALYEGRPVAFTAVIHWPHKNAPRWREHRTVCLPDFQGVGIGMCMSEYVASLFRSSGKPYTSVTGNPSMIYHRARSPLWNMRTLPSLSTVIGKSSTIKALSTSIASNRLTASFDYLGPARFSEAKSFGLHFSK